MFWAAPLCRVLGGLNGRLFRSREARHCALGRARPDCARDCRTAGARRRAERAQGAELRLGAGNDGRVAVRGGDPGADRRQLGSISATSQGRGAVCDDSRRLCRRRGAEDPRSRGGRRGSLSDRRGGVRRLDRLDRPDVPYERRRSRRARHLVRRHRNCRAGAAVQSAHHRSRCAGERLAGAARSGLLALQLGSASVHRAGGAAVAGVLLDRQQAGASSDPAVRHLLCRAAGRGRRQRRRRHRLAAGRRLGGAVRRCGAAARARRADRQAGRPLRRPLPDRLPGRDRHDRDPADGRDLVAWRCWR